MKGEYQLSHKQVKSSQIADKKRNSIILLLDGLTDSSNIGALFRLVDATHIEGIYGYKTDVDIASKKIDAVSRHTSKHILYKELNELEEVKKLTESFYPVALEYTNRSIPFSTYGNSQPTMLIIGNEQRGVSQQLLELCKTSLHVPMHGRNSSMNVASATGIVLYHLIGLS